MSVQLLQQRIASSVKVARITLCLSGIALTVVQIAKYFAPAEEQEFASLFIGFVLGVLLIVLSFPPLIDKIIGRFASRVGSRSFAIYIYILPIILVIIFVSLKSGMDAESWRRVSSEGGVSEYGTALAYLLTSGFAYPIYKQFRQEKRKFLAFSYGIFAFVSFVVGMEEISWGQRLIGFEVPQFLAEHNTQSELTLHNLSFYERNFLSQSFMLAGFLGSFSWIVLHYWQKRQQSRKIDLSYILPNWSISSFFYPILIFWIVLIYAGGMNFLVSHDQEHCEFIMSLGVLMFVVVNFFRQAREIDMMNHQHARKATRRYRLN